MMGKRCAVLFALILMPSLGYGEFKLEYGDRELIGAPVAVLGVYYFLPCNAVPVKLPNNATLTFSEDIACEYESSEPESTSGGSDTVSNAASVDWVVPEPCLLYTSPSPRDRQKSRMPSSA